MDSARLDDVVRDNRAAILATVSATMRGDEDMGRVARQRRLSEPDLSEQVLGFWLEGIRSDLALGSTVAMEQNVRWLLSFRDGHALPFTDSSVHRCFAELSEEIEKRIASDEGRREYATYRHEAEKIIRDAFPAVGGE